MPPKLETATACPLGARVTVVSYNSNIRYLIHFSEFYSKNQLLNKLKNLVYERSSSERDIARVMRFIARNVFKRTRQGPHVRKVAVFFSNGPSADEFSINAAVLEYSAFDIIPVVISFNEVPHSSFILSGTESSDDIYDFCERRRSRSPPAYVDAAFILDSSQKMSGATFEKVKDFLSRVLDNFDISSEPVISSTGDRVAMVNHAPPGFKPPTGRSSVKAEFYFVTYSSRELMKRHIQGPVQQLNGAAALGHAIQWTVDNIFLTTHHSRQHKAIIVISAGETSFSNVVLLHIALSGCDYLWYSVQSITRNQALYSTKMLAIFAYFIPCYSSANAIVHLCNTTHPIEQVEDGENNTN
ncbi:putative proline-rich protein 21 [Platysternon megacephalum]|uniref:Putative proline-rich protein 21 n=1 Tax=Platysternon megacephalum TaxID=55544 RepID=A0A4D9E4V3_9SAUR|nr:putative proline-rich protein 21 [Platysternon megacephalum]